MDEYLTVKKTVTIETVIERSRFITSVKRTESEEEARGFIDEIRKRFPDATHNCYAYIAERGAYSRYSDDGEPSGTAGPPIFDVLKNNKLFDTAIVVTRYFGGVKLGTGGLTRAYGGCASQAVKEAGIARMCLSKECSADLSYGDFGSFQKLYRPDLKVISTDFGDAVRVSFAIKKSAYNAFIGDFCDVFAGRYEVKDIGERFVEF